MTEFEQKNLTRKNSNSRFLVLNTFWNILNRFRPKKYFRLKFFDFVIFTILAILAEKRQSPSKKILHGKNFRFRDFSFEIRYETFWIDSNQKNFFDQNFYLSHVFALFAILAEKRLSPTKKILHGKKFSISRFSF